MLEKSSIYASYTGGKVEKVTYQGVSDFFIVTVEAPHTHSFGEWMIVTNPTCTETGIKEWECDCGHTERSEVAATGHQWDEGKVTKEATKNSDGVRTFTCTVCKKTRTEVVKAVAAISEPSDHVDTSETTQSESLPEKGESAGELQSSNTEQSSRLSWWIIAAIALILIVGVIVGTTILRKRKKVLLVLTPKEALMLLPIRMKGVLGRKEWSDLKKRHTALFLAFVLLLTTLCTCGQQAKQTEQSESSSGKPTKGFVTRGAEKPSSEQSKEIAVTELYNEDGKGIFDDGLPYNYSFHVPQIEDDTADAAAINQEIASTYGEIAKVCLESIRNKEPPYCSSVEYESFRSGGVLTLVLKYAYFYDGFEGYATYIYGTAKGMRLSNRDILEMQDMTEAEYLSALRRAAAKDFDDAYHAGWGELEELHSSGYRELRRWTLSEQNLNLNLPLYLDDGVLHVIAPIGSIAGADYLSRDLTLKAEEDADHVEIAQLGDYLTVKRRGSRITLRVQQTPRLEALLGEYGLINVDAGLYDKDLTVNGLYGSYTKILCGEIGEADEPFLFLLTREGRVDYIDVLPCLRGGYFCGGGPLLGLANVKDLTHSSADGLPDICAVTQYGDQMGLWDIVSYQRYTMVDGLLNCDWSGGWFVGGTEASYSLTLMDGNSENFMLSSYVPNTDTAMNFSGNLTYLGMTEKGAVYAYWLWGEFSNGPGQTGVVALDQRSEFNGGDYESTLTVTELGGTPFLGNQTGDMTALAQSFG